MGSECSRKAASPGWRRWSCRWRPHTSPRWSHWSLETSSRLQCNGREDNARQEHSGQSMNWQCSPAGMGSRHCAGRHRLLPPAPKRRQAAGAAQAAAAAAPALTQQEYQEVCELGDKSHHEVGHHAEHRGLGNLQQVKQQQGSSKRNAVAKLKAMRARFQLRRVCRAHARLAAECRAHARLAAECREVGRLSGQPTWMGTLVAVLAANQEVTLYMPCWLSRCSSRRSLSQITAAVYDGVKLRGFGVRQDG